MEVNLKMKTFNPLEESYGINHNFNSKNTSIENCRKKKNSFF